VSEAGTATPGQQPPLDDDGEPSLEGCFAEDGTDLTLIAQTLAMTPTERLERLQAMVNFLALARPFDEG
jgi:hypothetical protein